MAIGNSFLSLQVRFNGLFESLKGSGSDAQILQQELIDKIEGGVHDFMNKCCHNDVDEALRGNASILEKKWHLFKSALMTAPTPPSSILKQGQEIKSLIQDIHKQVFKINSGVSPATAEVEEEEGEEEEDDDDGDIAIGMVQDLLFLQRSMQLTARYRVSMTVALVATRQLAEGVYGAELRRAWEEGSVALLNREAMVKLIVLEHSRHFDTPEGLDCFDSAEAIAGHYNKLKDYVRTQPIDTAFRKLLLSVAEEPDDREGAMASCLNEIVKECSFDTTAAAVLFQIVHKQVLPLSFEDKAALVEHLIQNLNDVTLAKEVIANCKDEYDHNLLLKVAAVAIVSRAEFDFKADKVLLFIQYIFIKELQRRAFLECAQKLCERDSYYKSEEGRTFENVFVNIYNDLFREQTAVSLQDLLLQFHEEQWQQIPPTPAVTVVVLNEQDE